LGYEEAASIFLPARKRSWICAAVPDQLVDDVHLVGPRAYIRERLAAWREAGKKRHVDTMLIGSGQREALELLAEELL
ncbi:MAG TPA: LLM class F420-dependent oxidoreductase, partial [Myxococcota bacterium]|nr:LLM class F420-dependent oxidoreductase [Myxococcota bacterium]